MLAAAGCPHACQLVTAPVRIQRRWRAHATPARKEGAALQRLIQRANTGGQSADNGHTLYVPAAPRGRLRATAYLPRRTARDTPVRGSIVRGTPIWRTQARRFPTYPNPPVASFSEVGFTETSKLGRFDSMAQDGRC